MSLHRGHTADAGVSGFHLQTPRGMSSDMLARPHPTDRVPQYAGWLRTGFGESPCGALTTGGLGLWSLTRGRNLRAPAEGPKKQNSSTNVSSVVILFYGLSKRTLDGHEGL